VAPIPPRQRQLLVAIVAPFQAFFRLEAAGGLALMAAAVLALAWANSSFSASYDALFHGKHALRLGAYGVDWTLHHIVNDALMTLFFAVAGLEIKRELAQGELRGWSKASLPLVAALGGMLVPAGIYLAFNPSGPGRAGWGVPMATDIAFALGCLSLVKQRVPPSLFVFLTALAIFDDLGAIVVIALFYGGGANLGPLGLAGALTLALVALGRAGVQHLWPYALLGSLLWGALLGAGLHPTLAGVVVGLSMPSVTRAPHDAGDVDPTVGSPLDRAMRALHGVVAFGIVPLFALGNAGVELGGELSFGSRVTLGALFGLALGKPVGVGLATFAAVRFGLAPKPTGATWPHILGVSCFAGIGFTMSLLVGSLAFTGARELEDASKLGVLTASLGSALLGLAVLSLSGKRAEAGGVARDTR
jgi:Na+:H+ antiporter, NhaA family